MIWFPVIPPITPKGIYSDPQIVSVISNHEKQLKGMSTRVRGNLPSVACRKKAPMS